MSVKIEFVEKAVRPGARMSVLCRDYGISRETGYKWLNRFKREGPDGLDERSRRPKSSPLSTAEDLVLAILKLREAYPRRGPRKLRVMLERKFGKQTPSVATTARILKRSGMTRQRSRFRRLSMVEAAPTTKASACNEIWTVDFKGWWYAKDGAHCEPLTVRDAFSRYILAVKVLESPSLDAVRRVFEQLFRKYGVPNCIQCDNGTPFIHVRARGGLTRLSVWWMSLGIKVIRSRPGCPQDNGGHERMHRDLREDVQSYPADCLTAEQRACDRWKQEFNHVRPHDALGGKVPADIYARSQRRPIATKYLYPSSWIVRNVNRHGSVGVSHESVWVSESLTGQSVGLEPVQDTHYRLWFRDLDLGTVELPVPNVVIDSAVQMHLDKKKKAA